MATLFETLKICEYLDSVLGDTFGPCGLDVMLNSSSGKILITNSGGVILNSLSVGHPVARVVVDKIKTHNDITGDGCTAFVIVLTQALREVTKLLEVKGCPGAVELKPASLQTMVSLSQSFMYIQSELHSLIQANLDQVSISTDLMKDDRDVIKQSLTRIVNSSLNGRFSFHLQRLLSSLLIELIMNNYSTGSNFYQDVLDLIDDFPQLCVEFHGIPVHSSCIDEGFAIPREFATGQEDIMLQPGQKYFMFVVLQCSLESSRLEGNATMEVKNLDTHTKTLLYNQNRVLSLLKSLKQQDIKLLISSESVSSMVLHLCQQLGIAVIQMVPMETINYICKHANLQPLCSVNHYEFQNISDMFKGKGLSCKAKSISGQKYVQLCTTQSVLNTHHIVLCAPTQGLCQQYCIALLGALKCFKMSFSESRQKLTVLPGCGSVEFVLSKVFGNLAKTTANGQMASAYTVLSKSLLRIPKMLHRNSHQSKDRSFVRIQQKIESSWKKGTLLGIDGRTGDAIDPYSNGVYEPYVGKLLWISHLLQCLSMVLRIDKIVAVRCANNKTVA